MILHQIFLVGCKHGHHHSSLILGSDAENRVIFKVRHCCCCCCRFYCSCCCSLFEMMMQMESKNWTNPSNCKSASLKSKRRWFVKVFETNFGVSTSEVRRQSDSETWSPPPKFNTFQKRKTQKMTDKSKVKLDDHRFESPEKPVFKSVYPCMGSSSWQSGWVVRL